MFEHLVLNSDYVPLTSNWMGLDYKASLRVVGQVVGTADIDYWCSRGALALERSPRVHTTND